MENRDHLFNLIKALCSNVTEKTYNSCITQGYDALIKLHLVGLTQREVYQQLLEYYNGLDDGLARDCAADIMDFVVGWCAPQWHIWRDDGQFDRIKK